MTNFAESQKAFENAQKVIPGGVNSPVRAFGSVGGDPLFIASANRQIPGNRRGLLQVRGWLPGSQRGSCRD